MHFQLFIAKRYLISKKSQNAINIISYISIAGIVIGTTALITILSVFNGFDSLVKSLFNSFNPDLKISPVGGKTFLRDSSLIAKIKSVDGVLYLSETVEENILMEYEDKQHIGIIKGVDKNFVNVSGIDTMMAEGEFVLMKGQRNVAMVGAGVAYALSIGIQKIDPLIFYIPKKDFKLSFSLDPDFQAFNRFAIMAEGVFAIHQDFDSKYVFVPLDFACKLLEYTNQRSSLEIKLKSSLSQRQKDKIKEKLRAFAGKDFTVKDRYEQQEFIFRIMRSEKWMIFLILTFILAIASFNVMGSLSMLILEKKQDINTLKSMGASKKLISRIFLSEGIIVAFIGAVLGLFLGTLICLLQIHFHLISFPGGSIIKSYPVDIQWLDYFFVFVTVILIGFLAALYPVKLLTRKYL